MHDYNVIAYVDDNGQTFCSENCDPDANGDDVENYEAIFISNGAPAGTVCDGCGLVLNEDNEWVEGREPGGVEAMKRAIDGE